MQGGSRKCGGIFDIDKRREKLKKLEEEAAKPDFWDHAQAAQANIAAANTLRALVEPFTELEQVIEEGSMVLELLEMEDDPAEQKGLIDEAATKLAAAKPKFDELEMKSLLSGDFDRGDAYLSLNAGAGGTESCDWAGMLFRMYNRYAERHGFQVRIMDYQPGDEAGIKSVTFMVQGPYAYGYLRGERGVHRLVRISPFDANKRRHTSFVAVDVIAAVEDDVDITFEEKDLRIDTFRSSGAGGQHVNTTDSAVRITHLPTGIVVQCQAERSQHKNRAAAMKMLAARLYDYEIDKKRKEMEKFYGAKGEIAWGSQIRSYVMQPYTMVNDHRSELKVGNVAGVLDGDIDQFIYAYLKNWATQ